MGIKDLWTILGPYCEKKPLYELQGKTVAVDLSCWICEAQNIADYQVQPRMYLRNLYFRTCYLLLMEVNPVFILEGEAPTLKHGTIAARNNIQFKGSAPRKEGGPETGKGRSRFHYTLKQCEDMLRFIGLNCITGKGEAEAMCAYLNEDGMVSGCISQDSDCFAYGANVVYRNFSISTQGSHASSGGSIDVYDIRKLTKSLGFGRNKIIALALLVGSDYNDGVLGIGKESVLKLFEHISEEEILQRLRSWRNNSDLYDEYYRKLNNKNLCSSCGHLGKITAHNKSGCRECRTSTGCDSSLFKQQRMEIKNELNMRTKALACPDFPNEELIQEFLVRKDNVSSLNLKWKKPDLVQFVKFAAKFLTWEEVYSFEKFLPVLTRWQLINPNLLNGQKGILYPDYIKKARTPKGVPSYEIIWKDKDACFVNLIPEEQLSGVDLIKLYSTIEPQHLTEKAYPDLVEIFKQSKIKPKKATTTKRKKDKPIDASSPDTKPKRKTRKKATTTTSLEDSFNELTIDTNKGTNVKNNKQTKTKLNKNNNNGNIGSYLKKAVMNTMEKNKMKEKSSSTASCSNLNASFDVNGSDFDDDDDENIENLDLSNIVENIVQRNNPLKDFYNKNEFNEEEFVINKKVTNKFEVEKEALNNFYDKKNLNEEEYLFGNINNKLIAKEEEANNLCLNDDYALNKEEEYVFGKISNKLVAEEEEAANNLSLNGKYALNEEEEYVFEKINNKLVAEEEEANNLGLNDEYALNEEEECVFEKISNKLYAEEEANNLQESSFFCLNANGEEDLFEKTFNNNKLSSEDSDTEEYDIDEIKINDIIKKYCT